MQKIFTILSITYQETGPEYGSVTWMLRDEAGHQRRVVALTVLNRNGEVNEVHPVHLREVPLVDRLQAYQVNDQFNIDFSQFNAEHDYKARMILDKTDEVFPDYHRSTFYTLWGVTLIAFVTLTIIAVMSWHSYQRLQAYYPAEQLRDSEQNTQ